MAGENSLPALYYHDDQQLVTELISAPAAGAGTPLLYADRSLIIDSITIGILTGTSTNTLDIVKTSTAVPADGVITPSALNTTSATILAGTSGTVPAGTANANSVVFLTTESGVGTLGATTKLDNTKNTLEAGNWLFLSPSGAMTSAAIAVQIRFRSRPK
jgi:hypothetical protein